MEDAGKRRNGSKKVVLLNMQNLKKNSGTVMNTVTGKCYKAGFSSLLLTFKKIGCIMFFTHMLEGTWVLLHIHQTHHQNLYTCR